MQGGALELALVVVAAHTQSLTLPVEPVGQVVAPILVPTGVSVGASAVLLASSPLTHIAFIVVVEYSSSSMHVSILKVSLVQCFL